MWLPTPLVVGFFSEWLFYKKSFCCLRYAGIRRTVLRALMQTSFPQRAFAHSKRVLKRARGHPREWPPAIMPVVLPPQHPVVSVPTLPSGWSPPLGSSPDLPFRVRVATHVPNWCALFPLLRAPALFRLAEMLTAPLLLSLFFFFYPTTAFGNRSPGRQRGDRSQCTRTTRMVEQGSSP